MRKVAVIFCFFLSACTTSPPVDPIDAACGVDEDSSSGTYQGIIIGIAAPIVVNLPIDTLECRADHGDRVALYKLGNLYLLGERLEQDYEKAASLFYEAAKDDDGKYPVVFEGGYGSTPLRITAREIRPATKGLPQAQYALGLMYATGKGVGEDIDIAKHWFEKSADQGFAPARMVLDSLPE